MRCGRITKAMAVLACAAALAFPGAARGDGQSVWVKVDEDSCLCIRAEPAKGARIKYRLPRGTKVDITEEQNGWCYVRCCEDGGWAWGAYLSAQDPDEAEISTTGIVSANGRVAMRVSPGGKRVGWVQPGDTVTVLSIRTDDQGASWAAVDGGYIAMTYIQWEEDEHENLQ